MFICLLVTVLQHPESALTYRIVGVSQARLPTGMGFPVSKSVPVNDYAYCKAARTQNGDPIPVVTIDGNRHFIVWLAR